jgi:polysaccharide deacetylase family protein (PEP-CTERM system associated)
MLDLLSEAGVHSTCFFIGWIAKKYPHLIREAHARGHEIASHSFAHRLVYEMTPTEFYEDALLSKNTLEQITGREILGYRCAGFSVTEKTPWFFDELIAAGFRYDTSVFPARRAHGGLRKGISVPHLIWSQSKPLIEFPTTTTTVLGKSLCVFGGGYLRLAPLCAIKRMTRSVLNEGRPVIFYIHPREIDPQQPRLAMNMVRRFKSYVNLAKTETKIRQLLTSFQFTTFRQLLPQGFYGSGS